MIEQILKERNNESLVTILYIFLTAELNPDINASLGQIMRDTFLLFGLFLEPYILGIKKKIKGKYKYQFGFL